MGKNDNNSLVQQLHESGVQVRQVRDKTQLVGMVSGHVDGMADFDLGELAEGRYSTIIEPTGGKKIRGKSFTVDGSRAACAFTFDLAASDWTGGCD